MSKSRPDWGPMGRTQLVSIILIFVTGTIVAAWAMGPLQQGADGDNSIIDPSLPSSLGGTTTGILVVAVLAISLGLLALSLRQRPLGRRGRIGGLMLAIMGVILAWGYRMLSRQVDGANTAGVLLLIFATPIVLALIVSAVFSLKREYLPEQKKSDSSP
jgi:hypothetical protein